MSERCQFPPSHEIPSSESTPRSDSGGSDSEGAEFGTTPPVGSALAFSGSAGADSKVANFIPTTFEARKLTLLYTMMYWRSKRKGCCPMHNALEDVADLKLDLMNYACRPSFDKGHKWQCEFCGILDEGFRRAGKGRCHLCRQLKKTDLSRPNTNSVSVGTGPPPCSFGKAQL